MIDLSRRSFLGLTMFGVADAMLGQARAERFVDRTGLGPGRFIWQASISPHGPVIIVVLLNEQLVHVYRNGVEVGISRCKTLRSASQTPKGVFRITGQQRARARGRGEDRFSWTASAIHAERTEGHRASLGCVALPAAFARLLYGISGPGTAVAIADERSLPQRVRSSALLPSFTEPATAGWRGTGRVVTAAWEGSRTVGIRSSAPISVVISAKDGQAYVERNGALEFTAPVNVRNADRALGFHVYTLNKAAPDGRELNWLAFGLDDSAGGRGAGEALDRVSFRSRHDAHQVAGQWQPGSTVVIMDGQAPGNRRSVADRFILARSEEPSIARASQSTSRSDVSRPRKKLVEDKPFSVQEYLSRT